MVKAVDPVNNFIAASKSVLNYFNCTNDYFIKPLENAEWSIYENDDYVLLTYWENNKRKDAVVPRKNGKPMIYISDKYTMVIAIDCIKIAFILTNDNKK